jgi:hypothetical protein
LEGTFEGGISPAGALRSEGEWRVRLVLNVAQQGSQLLRVLIQLAVNLLILQKYEKEWERLRTSCLLTPSRSSANSPAVEKCLILLLLVQAAAFGVSKDIEISVVPEGKSTRCAQMIEDATRVMEVATERSRIFFRKRRAYVGRPSYLTHLMREAKIFFEGAEDAEDLFDLYLKAKEKETGFSVDRSKIVRRALKALDFDVPLAQEGGEGEPSLLICLADPSCRTSYPTPKLFRGTGRTVQLQGAFVDALPNSPQLDVLFSGAPGPFPTRVDFAEFISKIVFNVALAQGLDQLDSLVRENRNLPEAEWNSLYRRYVDKATETPLFKTERLFWYLLGRAYQAQDDFMSVFRASSYLGEQSLAFRDVRPSSFYFEDFTTLGITEDNFYDRVIQMDELFVQATGKKNEEESFFELDPRRGLPRPTSKEPVSPKEVELLARYLEENEPAPDFSTSHRMTEPAPGMETLYELVTSHGGAIYSSARFTHCGIVRGPESKFAVLWAPQCDVWDAFLLAQRWATLMEMFPHLSGWGLGPSVSCNMRAALFHPTNIASIDYKAMTSSSPEALARIQPFRDKFLEDDEGPSLSETVAYARWLTRADVGAVRWGLRLQAQSDRESRNPQKAQIVDRSKIAELLMLHRRRANQLVRWVKRVTIHRLGELSFKARLSEDYAADHALQEKIRLFTGNDFLGRVWTQPSDDSLEFPSPSELLNFGTREPY